MNDSVASRVRGVFGPGYPANNILDYITGTEYEKVSFEIKTQESLKTNNYNTNMVLNRMLHKLNNIENKLDKE